MTGAAGMAIYMSNDTSESTVISPKLKRQASDIALTLAE